MLCEEHHIKMVKGHNIPKVVIVIIVIVTVIILVIFFLFRNFGLCQTSRSDKDSNTEVERREGARASERRQAPPETQQRTPERREASETLPMDSLPLHPPSYDEVVGQDSEGPPKYSDIMSQSRSIIG